MGLSLDPLGPHFGRPTFELIAFVLVRLSPDECWRTPVESKRILRNRLAIIEVLRQKVFNSRLPQQAESKKQGGRRCVARRASSIMEGCENQFRQRIEAENRGQARSSRLRYLARRPRWGGGSLRAFRRAGVIFDAVLFESCVGGVAVAMTFSSIFHFKFWFRWGVVLAAFLGAF